MYPFPENETDRIAAVNSYQVTNTPPEVSYDDIAELAAELCQCPVGMINIIADTNEWLKAKYGLPPNLSYIPRGTACSTAICQSDLLTVSDLSRDERFADHPAVTGEPHFRYYSGMPLINDEGYALGTVCVFDFEPREPSHAQLDALRRLSRQTMAHLELRRKLIELNGAQQALETAETRSREMLLNILPQKIAEELQEGNSVEPKYYDSATIMFTDFKGFTQLAEASEPRALVNDLNQYFSAFDDIVELHNIEKIKTIGDAYMCAGGLPEKTSTHARDVCRAALEIRDYMARVNRQRQTMRLPPWELRIGIHSGPVMAGVVGRKKFTYDIWGDAVNIAALMESGGEAGKITISDKTHHHINDAFQCTPRGPVQSKKKGTLNTWFLESI